MADCSCARCKGKAAEGISPTTFLDKSDDKSDEQNVEGNEHEAKVDKPVNHAGAYALISK